MTEEMAVYDATPDMRIARAPEAVMADAEKAAKVLVSVVSRKPRKVMINGEQYLECEDWQTVAQFYGVTAKVSWTRFIDLGGVHGYEAGADAIDRTGRVISSAEAMCLNDEERWSSRPKYEWHYVLKNGTMQLDDPDKSQIIWEDNPNKPGSKRPKREKVQVGEEVVPLFQLRSMAQTRACSKALKNVFAWVVVLAGYRSTPAEEMTGNEEAESNGKHNPPPPQRKSKEATPPPTTPPADDTGKGINPQQSKAIQDLCRKAGFTVGGREEGTSLSSFMTVAGIAEGKDLIDLNFIQAGEVIGALQKHISGMGDGQAQ